MALNEIYIQEIKEYPGGLKGVFMVRNTAAFILLYSSKHDGYVLREVLDKGENMSKEQKIRISDLLMGRFDERNNYNADTNDSITVSTYFDIYEKVASRYSIDFDVVALENLGHSTLKEYIDANGGNPWELEGKGVIQSIDFDETLDYVDTFMDTIEIENFVE